MKLKKFITAASALCLIGTVSPSFFNNESFSITANAAEILDSGYCHDIRYPEETSDFTYTYDSDGVLTISGNGDMYDFVARNLTPWYKYKDDIKKIIIGEGITSIGNRAFGFYEYCTEVSLPSTLKTVDEFYGFTSLKSITLPEGLEDIDIQAFCDCDSLKTVTIPSTVKTIDAEAFGWCDSLLEIKVAPGNKNFIDVDGVLYTKDLTKLLQFPNGKPVTSYTIEPTVTTIGEGAFNNAENLKEIILPVGLTTIEPSALSSTGIKTISIPSGVSVLNRSVFNSSQLQKVVIPENITKIDTFAFRNNKNLEKIIIKNPLCEIEDDGCTISSNLSSNVTFNGTIYGYTNSTAQKYAEKYNYKFVSLDGLSKLGDVNFDNHADSDDASLVLAEYARKATQKPLQFSSQQNESADVNFDGNIDSDDASLILSYYAYTAVGGTQSPEEFFF